MKRFVKYIAGMFFAVSVVFIAGCGGGGGGSTSNSGSSQSSAQTEGTAQLGNLANADVKIYEIENNGSVTLKWEENTSSGNSLEEIGKFNLHSTDLNPNEYYIYKVSGGEDWDADDDGVKDNNYTLNKGVIRAIAKGSDIQKVGDNFKVTMISEVIYEKVAKTLKYDFNYSNFENILNQKASLILSGDIDNDGNITYNDILQFDPAKDKNKLNNLYKTKFSNIIDTIHKGKFVLVNMDNIIAKFSNLGQGSDFVLSADKTKAYVACLSDGLKIIDLTDPTNPTLLGSYDTNGSAYGIALSSDGSKAYIADGKEGLKIIDVSNPSTPTLLGSYDTNGTAYRVAISSDGSKAYIADEEEGLKIIDVSNPSTPTLLGSYETYGSAYDVAVSNDGNKVYVADGNYGLEIFDVTDPSTPTLLGSYDTNGAAYEITLSSDGSKAYLTDAYGLEIVNISDPNNITLIGSYTLDYYTAFKVTPSKDETKAFIGAQTGLIELNISDPSNPTLITAYKVKGSISKVLLSKDETKAYCISWWGDLDVLDITDTDTLPYFIFRINNTNFNNLSISKDGKVGYIAAFDKGMIDINLSDAIHPQILGSFGKINVIKVVLSNDNTKAYAIQNNELNILNITNPSGPALLSYCDTNGSRNTDVVISKDETKAYVINHIYGLEIIDISDINNPSLITTYDLNNTFNKNQIALSNDGTKAYIANSGLKIVDISDPNNPQLLGSFNLNYETYSVALSKDGTKAYVGIDNYFKIIDVTNPVNPKEIGSYTTNDDVEGIVLSSDEKIAFVANYNAGVSILDISDPSDPKLIASINTLGRANSVTLSSDGTVLYVTNGKGGLAIIDLNLFN